MKQIYEFLYVEDVMKILRVSQTKAYAIMREINCGLKTEGYETIAGRVPKRRFCEKFYCGEDVFLDSPERRKNHVQKTKLVQTKAAI